MPFPTSYVTVIQLPDGEVLQYATFYTEVTAEGKSIAAYSTPRAYSLEDVLYIYDLYAVTNGQFCRFLWQEQWGSEAKISVQEVLLRGLTECSVKDLPFDPQTVVFGDST